MAVSAITGDSLREQGITGVEDLSALAPTLVISEVGANIEVSLRGIVTTNFVEAGDPATAFHVDGVYYARPSSLTGTFYDIERVEVLRGPQGTLYGRNANAGNINVITNKPQNELDAEIEVGFGNYSEKTLYGMLNMPVGDTLSARFAVNYLDTEGYIDEAFVEDAGSADDIAFRTHLLWEPTDATSLLISGDYWKTEGYPSTAVPISTGIVATGEPELDRFSTVSPDIENELWGLSAELNIDFDGFTLTSITGYRENNRDSYLDGDGRVDGSGVDTEQQINAAVVSQDQFSQEIRLTSSGEGDLEWLLGAYYLEEHQEIFATFGSLIAPGLGLTFPQPDTNAKSWSGFGQGTYHLTDTVRLTAGLRYSDEQKDRTGGTYLAFGVDPKDPSFVAEGLLLSQNIADVSWSKTTWKTGVEWDVASDSMIYLTVGTGFKAGGYFDGVQSETFDVSYAPEEILAWALGAKNTFFERRLQLNVEAFLYDYEGYQVSFVDPIPPFGGAVGLVTYNANEAEIYGLETELIYLVGNNGTLTASLSYLSTEFTDFEIERNVDQSVEGQVSQVEIASGNELPKAPERTASLAYSHSWTLAGERELTARVSATYTDDYYLFYNNLSKDVQDSYVKTDLSLSYQPVDDGWYVRGFVNNVTDELVCTAGDVGNVDAGFCFANKPRTYGVKVGIKF